MCDEGSVWSTESRFAAISSNHACNNHRLHCPMFHNAASSLNVQSVCHFVQCAGWGLSQGTFLSPYFAWYIVASSSEWNGGEARRR